jgi:hypothetical protein
MALSGFYEGRKDWISERDGLSFGARGLLHEIHHLMIAAESAAIAHDLERLRDQTGARSVRVLKPLVEELLERGKLKARNGLLVSPHMQGELARITRRRRDADLVENQQAELPLEDGKTLEEPSEGSQKPLREAFAPQQIEQDQDVGSNVVPLSLNLRNREIEERSSPSAARARTGERARPKLGKGAAGGTGPPQGHLARPETAEGKVLKAMAEAEGLGWKEAFRRLGIAEDPTHPEHRGMVGFLERVSRKHKCGWYAGNRRRA